MSTSLPSSMATGVAKTLVVGGQGHPPVCLWLGGASMDTWWPSAAECTTRKKKKVQWGRGGKGESWKSEGLPVPGLHWTLLWLVCCGFPGPLLLVFAVGVVAVQQVIIFQANGGEGGEGTLSVRFRNQLFVDCWCRSVVNKKWTTHSCHHDGRNTPTVVKCTLSLNGNGPLQWLWNLHQAERLCSDEVAAEEVENKEENSIGDKASCSLPKVYLYTLWSTCVYNPLRGD